MAAYVDDHLTSSLGQVVDRWVNDCSTFNNTLNTTCDVYIKDAIHFELYPTYLHEKR